MQSNDARILLSAAIPTSAAGIVAAGVAGGVAGGKGAIGAAAGALLVIVFFAAGLIALQKAAKAVPHLFQSMGLLVYMTQLLLLAIMLVLLRGTTLFDLRAFALSLVACTLVWVATQVRGHMKAKVLYVEPGTDAPVKGGSDEQVRRPAHEQWTSGPSEQGT
jgi:ATP synthase protein I